MTHEKTFSEIYYKPGHLCTGNKAIKKLHKETSLSKKDAKPWLAKQAFWQVHIPAPKSVHHPHYEITKPNEIHQFDTLYVPSNVVYGNEYKYILTDVDVASSYKVARALRNKKAADVAFALEAIYKKGGDFKYPKIFQIDNGSEFKSKKTKLLEAQNVDIKRATTKYKHTHTAFVEAFNKEIAKELFKPMDAQELTDPNKISRIWVRNLENTVKRVNNLKTAMIDMNPKDAIKLSNVELVKSKEFANEKPLPEDGLYRYFYQPGEQHGDQKRCATDFIWSKNTFRLDMIVQPLGNQILYYLQGGPERAFVREELMQIPGTTEKPPD